jgi:hypothetical protein
MANYIEKQMQHFDILHAIEIEERKWGWHPFYHLITSIHAFQFMFFHVHITNKKPQVCMMLCAT